VICLSLLEDRFATHLLPTPRKGYFGSDQEGSKPGLGGEMDIPSSEGARGGLHRSSQHLTQQVLLKKSKILPKETYTVFTTL